MVLWSDFQMNWKTFWCLLGVAVFLILTPFVFWSRSQNTSASMGRYKIDATLTLDGKTYTNSRIWAISCREWVPKTGPVPAKVCRFSGEALDLDLKARGHLFLLLRQSSAKGETSFWSPDQALARAIVDKTGKQALTGKHLPMIIYASNPNDPMTLKHVAPQTLNASLGVKSASLSVKVQPSFEKPSVSAIGKSLPWLKHGVVLRLTKDQAYNDNELEYIDFERKY